MVLAGVKEYERSVGDDCFLGFSIMDKYQIGQWVLSMYNVGTLT